MAAPTFRAAGLGPAGTTTSTTIPKPSGTTADDVLYALVVNGGAASPPSGVPSGWSLTAGLAMVTGWAGVYEHVAGAAEPTDYTWTGFTDSCAGSMICVSGADTAAPTHQVAATLNVDDSTPICDGVTTTAADCLIIGAAGVGDNVGVSGWAATDPPTLTERTQVPSTGGNDTTSAMATGPQAAAGPTGQLTATLAGSRNSVLFVIATQPPQAGGEPVTGTFAGQLPALTGTATGRASTSGTLAATLPPITGTAAGHASTTGALSGTLPRLTGTATGTASATATMDGQLPALTGTAAAHASTTGTLDAVLPSITGQVTAAPPQTTTGTFAGLLPAITGAATGRASTSGTFAGTLPAMTGQLTQTDAELPALSGTVTNAARLTATLAHADRLTGALTATGRLTGHLGR